MRRRKKGFVLLDIVMALFVIATLMLSCCALLIGSRRVAQQSQIQAAAYQIARQQLEILKSYKFANRVATTNAPFTIPDTIKNQFPAQSMTGTYSVQPYSAYTSPPMQQIVVRVTWKRIGEGQYDATSAIQLDSLVAQEPGR